MRFGGKLFAKRATAQLAACTQVAAVAAQLADCANTHTHLLGKQYSKIIQKSTVALKLSASSTNSSKKGEKKEKS